MVKSGHRSTCGNSKLRSNLRCGGFRSFLPLLCEVAKMSDVSCPGLFGTNIPEECIKTHSFANAKDVDPEKHGTTTWNPAKHEVVLASSVTFPVEGSRLDDNGRPVEYYWYSWWHHMTWVPGFRRLGHPSRTSTSITPSKPCINFSWAVALCPWRASPEIDILLVYSFECIRPSRVEVVRVAISLLRRHKPSRQVQTKQPRGFGALCQWFETEVGGWRSVTIGWNPFGWGGVPKEHGFLILPCVLHNATKRKMFTLESRCWRTCSVQNTRANHGFHFGG